jgi:hypothetical protein
LKAWYKFDGNYEDSSGNNNNLTNANATLTTAFIGDGVYFDSTGDIVKTLNNFPLFNMTSRMSISCWVRRTAISATRDFIWGQGPSNTYTQFGGTFVEGNLISFYIWGSTEIRPTTTFTNTTIFNHIVYTVGDGIAKIYLNGVESGSASYTNINIPAAPLFIGKQTPTEGTSTCVIDDFRYYDKVLTSTEISQLYNIPTQNTYTLNFPVPTIADINNNSNIVLRGAYDISLSTMNSSIIPKSNQYIPKPTTFASDLLSIRYNLLNPVLDPSGAQWTYNTSNTNVYHMGNVGIGTKSPEYSLDVRGSVNAKSYYLNGRQINEPISELGLSEGMIAQVRHLTYTQMEIKNNTGWDAINDNLTTGFVIAITPKSNLSKILVNIIVHIGLAASNYSVWWGIKLYRKIGSGDWTEVTGPNGTETGSAAATAGTPVWISYTMYAGDLDYQYKVTNVTGTYLDSPNTTSTVYYTAYWNNRLGDNPSAINTIYLNRAESHGDAYRPAPSSSWTASEIWYG